ncbi:hypothetical protein ACFQ0F_01675 [Paraperlucidibaca wandonensis]|uniref:Uncharacterized protein n=1 Tax=Paraperlucidibaca wandonensis TaxID=1268273 RepID=A0ABW3HCA6_9GAMM
MDAQAAFQKIAIQSRSMPTDRLAESWLGFSKSDDCLITYSAEEAFIQPPDNPPIQDLQGVEFVSGNYLKSLLVEDIDEADCELEPAGNLSDIVLLRPILLVKQPNPVITGDIRHSTLLIRKLNPERLYPVVWVNRLVSNITVESTAKSQKASKPTKASQLPIPKKALSKGDISRREAESLGISPAALRKRKSRERLRRLANEKK